MLMDYNIIDLFRLLLILNWLPREKLQNKQKRKETKREKWRNSNKRQL